VFFFYVLYLVSSINSLHDKSIDITNKKFWEVKKKIATTNSTSISFIDQELLLSYSMIHNEEYCLFKLGPIEVRRNGVISTMLFFIVYCLYMLLKFKKTV
jgi:hypothetical protein